MNKEKKFYNALQEIFVGSKIEGESGYVNLLKVKERYYSSVLEAFKEEVDKNEIITSSFKEEFFDKLYSFFDKYFSESGSVYFVKTASWQKVYEKVYTNNKDVVLFWKTHMLYYVKSDVLYNSIDVVVEDGDKKHNFYFDVSNLDLNKSNEKKKVIYELKKIKKENNKNIYEFNVMYSERGKITKIDKIVKETEIADKILKKAFKMFEKQSHVDFFINKNARVFLEEQLDLYLHQILINEENKFDQTRLEQIKTVKTFSQKIIYFISQFENELVRIWNKPRFALNSNYVITLDKLTNDTIEIIKNHSNFNKQVEEWEHLGILENKSFNANKLEDYENLPIDTKFFKDIETDILEVIEDIDDVLDGRIIHSENYQALNTLNKKYEDRIQTIYIDPPFNTGSDFAYIDKYQDSSWLTMMHERIKLSKNFLSKEGNFYLHLDRFANYYGRILLNNIFDESNFINEIIWRIGWVSGYKTQVDAFVRNHDTILFYANEKEDMFYDKKNSTIPYKTYPFDDFKKEFDSIKSKMSLDKDNIRSFDLNILTKKGKSIRVYPSSKKYKEGFYHIEDTWNSSVYESIDSNKIKRNVAEYTPNGSKITQKPEELMERIISLSSRKGDLVMDYFVGSGTSIAVAHKLKRKWIGIELNDYFESDLLIRMKWVISGKKVGISEKVTHKSGGFFKYYELEQYEDTLRNMKYKKDQIDILNDKKPFEEYIFFADNKLADVLEIEKDNIELNFDKLYKNIDWPETISNLTGFPIKEIHENYFILKNGENNIRYNTNFKEMTKEEKLDFIQTVKPLIWWGE